MRAFLLAMLATAVIAVGADIVLNRAGFSAAEQAANPGSVRLSDRARAPD